MGVLVIFPPPPELPNGIIVKTTPKQFSASIWLPRNPSAYGAVDVVDSMSLSWMKDYATKLSCVPPPFLPRRGHGAAQGAPLYSALPAKSPTQNGNVALNNLL